MTADYYFGRAFDIVVGIEAGYTNPHPKVDPGGETKYGISKRAYPHLDIPALTLDDARAIYEADYWRVCSCHLMPWPLSLFVFDCAVNQGQPTAKRLLQRALGVKVDGDIGPVTVGAAFIAQRDKLARFMMMRAFQYMIAPNFPPNGRGWFTRLFLVTLAV
jgi:lysozyme family protein